MAGVTFDRDEAHSREAIAASTLQDFAVPHLVVDRVFSEALVEQINRNWPDYDEGFIQEVPGNHILHLYRKDYDRIAEPRRSFWHSFNETLWPTVVGSVAEALAKPAYQVFGDLYFRHLSLDMPLTLMQADPTYSGHEMHTHFYHCPHWAFTMLLYIDPDDTCSRGTGIHHLLRRDGTYERDTSYELDDAGWRADVAMNTFHWLDPDRRYRDRVVDYKANWLFVFLDGPLSRSTACRSTIPTARQIPRARATAADTRAAGFCVHTSKSTMCRSTINTRGFCPSRSNPSAICG